MLTFLEGLGDKNVAEDIALAKSRLATAEEELAQLGGFNPRIVMKYEF